MSKEFKVGDRVKVVKKGEAPIYNNAIVGDVGKIIAEGTKRWFVRFDIPRLHYHTGCGCCEPRHGYWCTPDMLQDLSLDEKIIITTDGVTTTARRYIGKELQGTAEAKCSPSDTFDFEKGANLAFGRLIGGTVIKLDTEALAKALKNVPKLDLSTLGKSDHWLDRLKKAVEANPELKPEPKPKFKVGDLVRVTGSGDGRKSLRHFLTVGSLAVVKAVSSGSCDTYDYELEGSDKDGPLPQYVSEKDIELYEIEKE